MDNIKLPFGLGKYDNKIYHISEVKQGKECNCICPYCGQDLLAKKGNIRSHHFAHVKEECKYAFETSIHMYIKEILSKNNKIYVPGHNFAKEMYLHYNRVELETRFGGIIPDIAIYAGKQSKPLLIEVNVTHPIDDDKLEKIINMGISVLQINICDSNFDFYNFDKKDLEDIILHKTDFKEWAYNAYEDRKFEEISIKEEKRRSMLRKRKELFLFKQKIAEDFEQKYKVAIILPKECSQCDGIMSINKADDHYYYKCDSCKVNEPIGPSKYISFIKYDDFNINDKKQKIIECVEDKKERHQLLDFAIKNQDKQALEYITKLMIQQRDNKDKIDRLTILYNYFVTKQGKQIHISYWKNYYSNCPICGSDMVFRKSKKDNEIFLGCSLYPKCYGTKKIITISVKDVLYMDKNAFIYMLKDKISNKQHIIKS
ncbi:topoisomerase DNA-binding C4 zinc finger domain-containing protein [Thermoanaerobacterium sp. RBIITD]|uniref:topoisomerase DNA-binding C4 zinc finger domain-containing protein n=1 Tax=Thermoanaerobacterium sp. RBIITD TaxID=1550240 RepID=UPI000BB756A0|nr:topoisomerase DNA-binding C4 zinc finger domain-containing protein [Thermoanaerobacterium sp. RBIITD]SNX54228.1 Topoisomerase DNA binding C4 zinc finger [Thermoanaerobacterium sp. RBIITD]